MPNATSAVISYGTGTITLIVSETVDATPQQSRSIKNICIRLCKQLYDLLSGAKVVEYDSTNLTLVMTEEARVAAVRTSTFASNGDGDILADLQEGALDVGQNRHVEKTGIPIIEIPDTIAPKILSARLNYSFGELKLTFQETLDLTPATRFNASNIKFGNTSNDTGANFALDDLEGGGARLIDGGEGDAFIVTFLFSEEQRTTLLEFSGVPGGDEFAAFITFGSSSFVDLFLNPNVAGFQNLIEHPDVVPPRIQQITVFLGSGGVGCGYRFCGYIQFKFSEFIHKDSAKVNVSKAFIANDAFYSTNNYSDAKRP